MRDTATIDIRRAETRFRTDLGWLDSRHSFSFGRHYDPGNVGHGLLIVANDDIVAAGAGFGAHSHADMEIVSWVLDGELRHEDSTGNQGVIVPGLVQRMSAGRGITHSEMNARNDVPVHFLQMWVIPDERGIEPSYEERDVADALRSGGLVPVASGRGHHGAVTIRQRDAVMWAARPPAGTSLEIPEAPYVHVYVAKGTFALGDTTVGVGDAARLTAAGTVVLDVLDAGELVVWESATASGR